jgi:nitrite reductase (NADH) large subunit
VTTVEEVKEVTGAFLQLYREEARYLDRTVHWVQRVGLDYVKQKVVDDVANRRALHERLLFALQDYSDPWLERAKGAARHEFAPIRFMDKDEVKRGERMDQGVPA